MVLSLSLGDVMLNDITVKNRFLRLQEVQHVPEIKLYLADTESNRRNANGRYDCWPYAWVGGQALARYIIDNPTVVKDKTVVDLASGSGIVAIAAKLAGAKKVIAMDDYDPCIECIHINSKANNVDIEIVQCDIFNYSPTDVDVFLIGDPFLNENLFDHLKQAFNPIVVGCPIRMPHYSSYISNIVQTYQLETKFDGEDEYEVYVWRLNE